MECPCLLCYFQSMNIRDKTQLKKICHDGLMAQKFKEPDDCCPFIHVWNEIKGSDNICCCLQHECSSNIGFCLCPKCNILTQIRMTCYPKHYKNKTCNCEVCEKLLPVNANCTHHTCEAAIITFHAAGESDTP